MGHRYFELRLPSTIKTAIGIDIAQHFHTRQFLGSALVVCENPFAMLSVVRKAWHKKIRATQNDRARTLNAEEILRFTRRIIQMQRLRFTSSHPDDTTCADVYFVTPDMLASLPSGCYSIYMTCPVAPAQVKAWSESLLNGALVVNYDVGINMRALGFLPKSQLENQLLSEWNDLLRYLHERGIRASQLDTSDTRDPDLNDVLDILLGSAKEFTERTAMFQRQLDTAQPLTTISQRTRDHIAVILRLAHRVQALAPPNPHLKQLFGGSETFFLRDRSTERIRVGELLVDSCS